MSLQYGRLFFVECPTCAAKVGSPTLCQYCLERRELMELAEKLRMSRLFSFFFGGIAKLCPNCGAGRSNPECKVHGR